MLRLAVLACVVVEMITFSTCKHWSGISVRLQRDGQLLIVTISAWVISTNIAS